MNVSLKWMNPVGWRSGAASFGVPWEKGALDRHTPLYLYDEQGNLLPAQHEARAYWPDGSVKWTLHSASLPHEISSCTVSDEAPDVPLCAPELKAERIEGGLRIENGADVWTLMEGQDHPIRLKRGGKEIVGQLELLSEQPVATGCDDTLTRAQWYDGRVKRIVLEREGAQCCVVRLTGSHYRRCDGRRTWIPFELRLYFFAGQASVRMVHTMVYDGNEEEDFIRGVGMSFRVPLTGEVNNRFVRLGGETGLFCESPMLLWNRRRNPEVYRAQLEGQLTTPPATMEPDMTVWSDYKLTQLSSTHYDISKRTSAHRVYVRGAAGQRAMGVGYAGGSQGGLAVFKRDFWQKAPASIEINGMSSAYATIRLWFHSPDGQRMDMRHYDFHAHPNACYEGFNEMHATPTGVANTNEIVIEPFDACPDSEGLWQRAEAWQNPNLLLCSPGYICQTKALGDSWAPEDRSTPALKQIEEYMDQLFEQHKRVREQYDMYGFWDYGDIRHTYDPQRHNWLYDMGGFAWQNTELVPNLWLWYGFLRSGREDYFRWAEVMTRHCAEVDLYHTGPYRGLGSRHNVVHWGCSCKECRMTLSQLYKPYYYLTGDERTGRIMTEMKDADAAMMAMDALRHNADTEFPVHARFGPDLMVVAGNWLTHWERTEDPRYRDRLVRMMEHFKAPDGFCHVTVWGMDPLSGDMALVAQDPPGGPNWHFNYCFGSEYVWPEVLGSLDDPALWQAFLNSGLIFSNAGDPAGLGERFADAPTPPRGNMKSYWNGVAAYAAGKCGDKTLAIQCWKDVTRDPEHCTHDGVAVPIVPTRITGAGLHKLVDEVPYLSGNSTGMWGSHVIVMLAHIAQYLEDALET